MLYLKFDFFKSIFLLKSKTLNLKTMLGCRKKVFFSGPATKRASKKGGGKGLVTKKKELFLEL